MTHLIDQPTFGVEAECCCCDPPQLTANICAGCRRYKETLILLEKNYKAFRDDIIARHRDQHEAHLLAATEAAWEELPAKRRKERS